MVIGLFPSLAHLAVCLSNLAEADFASGDLSVIMKTRSSAESLAKTSGRLNSVSVADLPRALVDLGVPPDDATTYRDGVLRGDAFIAVDAPGADDAAKEILEDHEAANVRIVRTR